ncbi:hypothetical protein ER308_06495 [Egibacter rhizosphaerae]|uniref:SCP domain-containing protein n=1 Tax=Egibacter rhizosphaerae TaxID=1670831 RepID=A0A411YDI4_9ACTN|nr:cell wall-binding repeat-containing protein [Egibacter rhizosphaerae]QBI19222.1 hypothetical protein ER308_06495 [Egibacter rhizosphaerae]
MARAIRIPLATLAVVLLAATFWATAATAEASEAADGEHAAAEERFVGELNAERADEALDPLIVDLRLTSVARDWATRMHRDGELRHNPGYSAEIEGSWQSVGENVGYTVRTGAGEAELVDRLHDAFMDSDGHRRNILGDWTHVGVGVSVGDDDRMWVTVNFMRAPDETSDRVIRDATAASRELFASAGEPPTVARDASGAHPAARVVLGRADVFADSLAGSALAGSDGPILLTEGPRAADADPVVHPGVRAEIDRVLAGDGTVYVLGGEAAISSGAVAELEAAGYAVERVRGEDRVGTAVRVAETVAARDGTPSEVLLATAADWADAVAGGAYAAQADAVVLLTPQDRLDERVTAYLDAHAPETVWALGGEAALDEEVVDRVGGIRTAGADRSETSLAIATDLWERSQGEPGNGFLLVHGYTDGGWAEALSHAPASALSGTPQLLVADEGPESVRRYLADFGDQLLIRATSGVPSGALGSVETAVAD